VTAPKWAFDPYTGKPIETESPFFEEAGTFYVKFDRIHIEGEQAWMCFKGQKYFAIELPGIDLRGQTITLDGIDGRSRVRYSA
jgi:hypothetical protein